MAARFGNDLVGHPCKCVKPSVQAWSGCCAAHDPHMRRRRFQLDVQRVDAEAVEQGEVAFGVGVASRQQFFAVEDRVGAGEEAQRLQFIAHLRAPR